ncbi:MAG: hypothetical protein WAR83_01390, partial [Flavobacteriales bacterium]
MNNITKFGFSAALIGLSVSVFAQSPRMCVVEEATQASCPPCASQNPGLQAILDANSTKAVFVGYQVWWPGVDAMYNDNTSEVQSRINTYYSDVDAAPNVVMNGSSGAQAVSYVTQARINNTYAETSEFDLTVSGSVNGTMMNITGNISAYSAASGTLKLRLIITEKLIHTEDLAFNGTNGETEFHHVFKKFVNGPAGITLSTSWAPGDTYTINESFDLSSLNIYNYDELEVVALIQNDADKFIHQAARDSDIDITVPNAVNAGASSIAGLPDNVCSGAQTITPLFKIQNTGNDVLTSATVTYNVNGGTDQTYNWTGSLTTYQKDEMTLPAITFNAVASNVLNITVSNPNGVADPDASDDTSTSDPIGLAASSPNDVTVKIRSDAWGNEIYWEIRNSVGAVIGSGGNPNVGLTNIGIGTGAPAAHPNAYGNNTLYTILVPYTESDCFTFHITDFYGDGLVGAASYYKVFDSNNTEIISGAGSYTEEMDVFEGTYQVGIDELLANNSLNLFPNPVNGPATLSFDLKENAKASVEVLALTGQAVYTQNFGSLASGAHVKNLDLSALS